MLKHEHNDVERNAVVVVVVIGNFILWFGQSGKSANILFARVGAIVSTNNLSSNEISPDAKRCEIVYFFFVCEAIWSNNFHLKFFNMDMRIIKMATAWLPSENCQYRRKIIW